MDTKSCNPKYVRVIKNWYPEVVKVTVGKIYTFPDIVFDDNKKANLNSDLIGSWAGYLELATKEEYDKQEGINSQPKLIYNYGIL